MAWVDFPFPQCPNPECGRSWVVSRHMNCPGMVTTRPNTMQLDPDKRQVRCDRCAQEWAIGRTNFHCRCGTEFDAAAVDEALKEILLAAELLARAIEHHRHELADIRRRGHDSIRSWLNGLAESIGGMVGRALGALAGWIAQRIFG